ncbi:MAG: pyridoxamine 5'-phosphate oxidase family protein [Acidobacteriota bacterium]
MNLYTSILRAATGLFAAALLTQSSVSAQPTVQAPPRDSVIAAARELIGQTHYCALITLDSAGRPQVRTMTPFPPEEDMTVWIATNSRSRKVQEIRKNPHVCLYYSDHTKGNGYVSITGTAQLIDDMSEKLKRKRAYWDQAFPDFTYLILIKVVPDHLDVLNYKWHMLNGPVTWRVPNLELDAK